MIASNENNRAEFFEALAKLPNLFEALSEAQGEFSNPDRNREVSVTMKSGGKYTFCYATFDEIIAMARPVLRKHGLCVIQLPKTRWDEAAHNYEVTVTTVIGHKSGESLGESISCFPSNPGIQEIGSVTSYLKRYAYTSMLSIAAEEDDDGNIGAGNDATSKPRENNNPQCSKCGTNAHVIAGKPEYGGGWVCFQKKGGCGAKWQDAKVDPLTEYKSLLKKVGCVTADEGSYIIGLVTDERYTAVDGHVDAALAVVEELSDGAKLSGAKQALQAWRKKKASKATAPDDSDAVLAGADGNQ